MSLILAAMVVCGLSGPLLPAGPGRYREPDSTTIESLTDPGTGRVNVVRGYYWKATLGYRDRTVLVSRTYDPREFLILSVLGLEDAEPLQAVRDSLIRYPFRSRIVLPLKDR